MPPIPVQPPLTEDEFVRLLAAHGMTESNTGRVHTVFMGEDAYRRMMVPNRDRRTREHRQQVDRAARLRREGYGTVTYCGIRLVVGGGGPTGCELHLLE